MKSEELKKHIENVDSVMYQKGVWSDKLHSWNQIKMLLESSAHAERCEWKLSDPDCDLWKSSCGIEWNFIASGPKENGVKFCVNCGKPVSLTVEKEND